MDSLDALAKEKGYTLRKVPSRKRSYYLMRGLVAATNPQTDLPFFSTSEARAFLLISRSPEGNT
jgi:hypothetical protein